MRYITPLLAGGILCFLALAMSRSSFAQQTAVAPQTNDQPRISSEERENQRAQAEYYREQTKYFRSVWKPGSDLVPWFTAIIALAGLFANAVLARRQERNTQFYEALKRFGDPKSPGNRASAVALLAQIATENSYRQAVIDHLTTGIALENDPVVVESIGRAIVQIAQIR